MPTQSTMILHQAPSTTIVANRQSSPSSLPPPSSSQPHPHPHHPHHHHHHHQHYHHHHTIIIIIIIIIILIILIVIVRYCRPRMQRGLGPPLPQANVRLAITQVDCTRKIFKREPLLGLVVLTSTATTPS
eukprot:5942942-Amphidinium_carterae.1